MSVESELLSEMKEILYEIRNTLYHIETGQKETNSLLYGIKENLDDINQNFIEFRNDWDVINIAQ